MDATFLVIGIGNTLRRDDGAGWLFAQALADALRTAGAVVELILQQQLMPETAEIVAEQGAAQVVFVDASVEAETVTLETIPDESASSGTSHHVAPATILAVARRLYGAEVNGLLVQLPARDLGHGEGLSDYAAACLDEADAIAANLLAGMMHR